MEETGGVQHSQLLLGGAVLCYLVLMLANPVRTSFRDGFRCVRRYATLWGTLAWFGVAYAAFRLAVEVLFFFLLPDSERPPFLWHRAYLFAWDARVELARSSILPALEKVAGLFNNVVTTYPISAIAAICLLANWHGYHTTLSQALRKRFGTRGAVVHAAVIICAIAAILKPCLYAAMPYVGRTLHAEVWLEVSIVADWLSFLFEYLLGVCVQIYLILLAYVWVRGITYDPRHLWAMAIRRLGAVARWAAVVMFLSTVLISWPLIAANLPWITPQLAAPTVTSYVDSIARPLLTGFLILSATMQITLTFHSESLRRAWRSHLRFLRANWWALFWFVVVAGVQFYLLTFINGLVVQGKGADTAVVIGWRLLFPVVEAIVAGWLLASWVCLFKRAEHGSATRESLVGF